jgi:hypothetical protein
MSDLSPSKADIHGDGLINRCERSYWAACTVALERSGIQTIEQRTCSTGEARAALAMTWVELPQFAATIVSALGGPG